MSSPSCPRCHEQVTLPASHARPETRVRCPLCSEEFLLSDVLAELPPQLIVVSATALAGTVLKSPPLKLARRVPDPDESPGEGRPLEFGEFQSPRIRRSGHSPRGERSPLRAVVGVIGGGVLGLILAVGILWWGFEKDPFDIGPHVSRYAPWVVPARFQLVPTNLELGKEAGREINTTRRFEGSSSTHLNSQNATEVLQAPIDAPPSEPDARVDSVDSDASRFAQADGPAVNSDPKGAGSAKESGSESESRDPSSKLPTEANPSATSSEHPRRLFPTAPVYSTLDLDAAVTTASDAVRVWQELRDEADVKKRDQSLKNAYIAVAELGHKLTFTPDIESKQRLVDLATRVVTEFSAQPKGLEDLARATQSWMKKPRAGGAVLLGTVRSIRMRGKLYETALDLGNTRLVTVITTADPSLVYGLDSRVVILGSIIDEPAKSLTEYAGGTEPVVLSGHAVLLSTPRES